MPTDETHVSPASNNSTINSEATENVPLNRIGRIRANISNMDAITKKVITKVCIDVILLGCGERGGNCEY